MNRLRLGAAGVAITGVGLFLAMPASADPGDAIEHGGQTANDCYKAVTGSYVPPPLTGIAAVDRAVGCGLWVEGYPFQAEYDITH